MPATLPPIRRATCGPRPPPPRACPGAPWGSRAGAYSRASPQTSHRHVVSQPVPQPTQRSQSLHPPRKADLGSRRNRLRLRYRSGQTHLPQPVLSPKQTPLGAASLNSKKAKFYRILQIIQLRARFEMEGGKAKFKATNLDDVARIKKKSIKSNRLLREFMMCMVHFRRYGCPTPRTCQDPLGSRFTGKELSS